MRDGFGVLDFFESLVIRYSRSIANDMNACGRAAHPNEGCALLFGRKFQETTPKNNTPRVVYLVEMVDGIPSSRLSWSSFFIDETILLEKSERAKAQGYKLVGIYHCHPAPAEPSSMDQEYMSRIDAYKPIYAVWVIQSTVGRVQTRAFFFSHNKLYEVRQEIS
jgi:proteasome lid subunit RPN8/RPN11